MDYSWIQLLPGSSWKEDLVYRYSHFHFSVIIVCWCHPTIHVSITFSDDWELTCINIVGSTTSTTGHLLRRQQMLTSPTSREEEKPTADDTKAIKWFDSRWHCTRATQGGSGIAGSRNTKWGEQYLRLEGRTSVAFAPVEILNEMHLRWVASWLKALKRPA
jgi:hypothetical protein